MAVLNVVFGQFVVRELDVLNLIYQGHKLNSIYDLLDVLVITVLLCVKYRYRVKHALRGPGRKLDQNVVQNVQEHEPIFVWRFEVYLLAGKHLTYRRRLANRITGRSV